MSMSREGEGADRFVDLEDDLYCKGGKEEAGRGGGAISRAAEGRTLGDKSLRWS